MVKVLIRRSDGRLQGYNVKRAWLKSHAKSIESVRYHKTIRKRSIYGLQEAKIEKKEIPTPSNRYNGVFYENVHHSGLTKVKEVATSRPIPDLKGQLRVKLKGWKGTSSSIVEGRSFKDDMDSAKAVEVAKGEAYSQAFAQFNYSPDGVNVLKIDFVYFIPINA